MALSYIGPTDILKRTNNLNTFKHNLKEHYVKEHKNSNSRQPFILKTLVCNIPSFQFICRFLNRHYSTFVEGPQCKYKQFDACIVLSCHQHKCYIFVNIDEYNLFDILLLLFTFLIFNLVFNHFLVIFHIFFDKCTLTDLRLASLFDGVKLSQRFPAASMLLSAGYKVSAGKTVAEHVFFPSAVELMLSA